MKMDIENYIKFALHVLISETQPKEKIIHHKIPGKPWEVSWSRHVYPTQ